MQVLILNELRILSRDNKYLRQSLAAYFYYLQFANKALISLAKCSVNSAAYYLLRLTK